MILTDDKQVEALEARRIADEQNIRDPPPTYASLQPPHPTPPSLSLNITTHNLNNEGANTNTSPSTNAPLAKPSNFVSISRTHSSVKETLVIDPNLFIPPFLRPRLGSGERGTEGEGRKNLRLESLHGHVNADITIVAKVETPDDERRSDGARSPQGPGGAKRSGSGQTKGAGGRTERVTMLLKSTHGGISAKIHGPPNRHPFRLHAQCTNGEVRLHIPRTFHGPVIVSHRHGFVRFSDSINRNLTTFGEVDNTRRCFLGDFSKWSGGDEGWGGDELVVDVKHGNVKIHYDDDAVGSVVRTRPTLLNRIFGF